MGPQRRIQIGYPAFSQPGWSHPARLSNPWDFCLVADAERLSQRSCFFGERWRS